MVFPYVNMLSYWVYLLAVLVLVASFSRREVLQARVGRYTRPKPSSLAPQGSSGASF